MKQLIVIVAAVVLVGCGESQQESPKAKPANPEADKALINAASWGKIEAIKEHLAIGADVNTKDSIGFSPLHRAAAFAHKEAAELLIANGASVNAKDISKGTPLHQAAGISANGSYKGRKEIVELLIGAGAYVNARTDELETPLDKNYSVREEESPEAKVFKKEISDLLRKHGGKTGEEIAIEELTAKAEAGDVAAQTNLGNMYSKGKGVSKDYVEAVKWYRKATEQGHAEAQATLGWMYTNGNGVPKDYVEAAKWYRKAAEQGFAQAQYNLGYAYLTGEGVTKADVEAYKWLNLAAAQGSEYAKHNIPILANRMTKEQIAEAQRLSSEFRPKLKPTSN